MELSTITDELIAGCYDEVYAIYTEHGKDDRAAKGSTMRDALLNYLTVKIHGE